MNADAAIVAALRAAGLCDEVSTSEPLTGGCIHQVKRLTLADGQRVVAKDTTADSAALLQEEAASLEALAATRTVLTPMPFGVFIEHGAAVFLMEFLEPAAPSEQTWRDFGEDLAALHAARVGEPYGFSTDNHLGSTLQPNAWCDDWVAFNAESRLGHQLRLLQRVLSSDERKTIQRVIDQVATFIPARPRPSLLHGDLWSGNSMGAVSGAGKARIAVIDPACSIGDGWADIAMMKLFGGFPQACYDAYAGAVDDHDRIESRIAVYQLYHVLNHVTIFGRGYAGQAMSLARTLLG